MTTLLPILAQLTRDQRWQALREGNNNTAYELWLLTLLGGVFALVMLWLWWRQRQAQLAAGNTGDALFHRLARRLGLSRGHRRMLTRITRHRDLPSPITLLASPRTMRIHAGAYSRSLGPLRGARFMRHVATLRRQVFG